MGKKLGRSPKVLGVLMHTVRGNNPLWWKYLSTLLIQLSKNHAIFGDDCKKSIASCLLQSENEGETGEMVPEDSMFVTNSCSVNKI